MEQLVTYLLEHLMLDFDGDLTLEKVREFLRNDESREAKFLLTKLVADRGVEEMMVCIADCLREHLTSGIKPEVIRDQLHVYAES